MWSGYSHFDWDRIPIRVQQYCSKKVTKTSSACFHLADIPHFRKFFRLQSSYQLRENSSVIRFILPLTIFQTICYLVFTTSSGVLSLLHDSFSITTYRTLFAAIYVSCTLIELVGWCWMVLIELYNYK